jgi:hypothetical protein
MRFVLCILIIVLGVLACGCTSSSTTTAPVPSIPTAPVIPDLTGTWAGPMKGYDEGTGFTEYPNLTMVLVVTDQKDRIFAGQLVFTTKDGSRESIGTAGVISSDGRTFSMAEKDSGYTTGRILSKDELELTYLHEATPYSAAIDTLKRV